MRCIPFIRLLNVVALGSGLASGHAQAPAGKIYDSYYEVMANVPWNVERSGPLVGVCPMVSITGETLKDVGRKMVAIGGLTAIVPVKMVTVNSRFTQEPNLYDGLPREAKVLYLLTLLNDEQWRKISGGGLTLADCNGPQVAVMQSILPNPFQWFPATIMGPRSVALTGAGDKPNELTNQQRAQVKLRVIRHLELTLPLENNRGFTGTTVRDNLPEGMIVPYIKDVDGDEFGQHVKVESENVPKKTQLDFRDSRLDAKLPLKTGEKLSDLIARVSFASGMKIYADPHYGEMRLFEAGTEATARDLLQGISLGVAGTYRRLGDSYILTNDLEGMAAHQARIAAWEDDLQKIVEERKTLWRNAVAKGKGMNKVRFNPGAYDSLTQSEISNLAENDHGNGEEHYVDTALVSEAVKREMREFKAGTLKLDMGKVGITSTARYELVLPNGAKPWNMGCLGNGFQFSGERSLWLPPKPDEVPLPFTSPKGLTGLLLKADTPQSAQALVQRVAQLGLREVWVESSSGKAIEAAVEAATPAGIKVRLAVRPWALEPGSTGRDLDRTVTGDQGKALAAKKLGYLSWQRFWQETLAFEPPTKEQLSPLDSQVPTRWASIAALARTKGLSGTALLDAYPIGYAQRTSRGSGSYFYSIAVDNFLSYGYSETQRIAYFQATHVDPLDFSDFTIHTNVNLDNVWAGGWHYGTEYEQWQQMKAKWIHDALARLTQTLSGAGGSVLLPGQPQLAHVPPYAQSYLYAWTPGTDLPTMPEDYRGDMVARASQVAVIRIMESDDPVQRNRVASNVKKQMEESGKPVILDFSAVPANRLDLLLKMWLKK